MAGNDDSLRVEIDNDQVITLHGEVDMAGGPLVEAAIREHDELRPVVIDMGDVSFIDSSGLRSLLAASRHAREHHTEVVLRSLGPEVVRLLEMTGTTAQFMIESRRV